MINDLTKKYYKIYFTVESLSHGVQGVEYTSRLELDSKPSVEDVLMDIQVTFGKQFYAKIVRIFTLEYELEKEEHSEILWFSDLQWEDDDEEI